MLNALQGDVIHNDAARRGISINIVLDSSFTKCPASDHSFSSAPQNKYVGVDYVGR